jgi:GST-like protein
MSSTVLYGVPGWGSVLAEALLAWCRVPHEYVDVEGFDRTGPARERLRTVNPLAQVPTLVLPDGGVLTESAAITLWLAETHPEAALAPPPGSPERSAFLRRLVWFVAAVYPTFTYGDYPERWAPRDPDGLRESTLARRQHLYLQLESELGDGPWVLGNSPSALDVYVGAFSHWRPGREWFEAHTPKLARIARAVRTMPLLAQVWDRNFPGT